MPKVRVEGRDEVYRFPDDTPREEIARQLRNYLFPRRPQQSTADTVAQTGSVAGLFAPGSGLADAIGVYPTGEGTNYPSMMENILSGNFADAGYQALGVVGDISYATAPITGPIGVGIGMAAKAPRAARAGTRALQGADRLLTSETVSIPRTRSGSVRTDVPRIWYHSPRGGSLPPDGGIPGYAPRHTERELLNMFGDDADRMVYISPTPLSDDAIAVDISSIADNVRLTGQTEGYAVVKGDIPPTALVRGEGANAGTRVVQQASGLEGISQNISRTLERVRAGDATADDLLEAASRTEVPDGAPIGWRKAEYDTAMRELAVRSIELREELAAGMSERGVRAVLSGLPHDRVPQEVLSDPRLSSLYDELRAITTTKENLTETVGREISRIEAFPSRINDLKGRIITNRTLGHFYGSEAARLMEVVSSARPTGNLNATPAEFSQSAISSAFLGDAPISDPRQMREAAAKLQRWSDDVSDTSVLERELADLEQQARNSRYRVDID